MDDFGVAAETADELLAFIATPGGTAGILAALEGYKGKNEVFDQGADELKTVARYMQAFGVPDDHFEIDLTIARGLDYYTGTVYGDCDARPSGDRLDLLGRPVRQPRGILYGQAAAGRGHPIGLTRLFYVLGEQGLPERQDEPRARGRAHPAHD